MICGSYKLPLIEKNTHTHTNSHIQNIALITFIDHSIGLSCWQKKKKKKKKKWQFKDLFSLRLQDINNHLHFGLAMSSKIANDIVSSLVKDYVIESTTLYVSIFRYFACIVTLFVYNDHIVLSSIVWKHCSIETSLISWRLENIQIALIEY